LSADFQFHVGYPDLSMAYASLSLDISDRIQPLLPALKSNWLIAHVVTCFIGYADLPPTFLSKVCGSAFDR
jgi:ABC-type transport system involved in cytochrome c biogenesis permease subunit